MTPRYLLHTSIVSAPASKRPNPQILRRLDEHGHESAIAAPVWHELMSGCRRLASGKRRDAIEHYLHDVVQASFPILPYDEVAATWHGYERPASRASVYLRRSPVGKSRRLLTPTGSFWSLVTPRTSLVSKNWT